MGGITMLTWTSQECAYPTPEPESEDMKDAVLKSPNRPPNVAVRNLINERGGCEERLATPPFPKPLALSYRNFHKYYRMYGYNDGERMEVGSRLAATFLNDYFPRPTFTFRRLPYGINPIIKTVKGYGTLYWLATLNDPCSSPFMLLFAIVTEPAFMQRIERVEPSTLQFSKACMTPKGQVQIDNQPFEHGQVVILGGHANPSRPSLEFYTFSTKHGKGDTLTPWFGQTRLSPSNFETNSFSFTLSAAGIVDQLFLRIVGCSAEDRPVEPNMKLESPPSDSENLRFIAESSNRLLHAGNRPNSEDDKALRYLQTLTMNQQGKVFESKTGRFLKAEKCEEAKRLAEELGYIIPPPKGRRSRKSGAKVGVVEGVDNERE